MSVYASLQYFWTKHHVVDPRALEWVAKITAATLLGAVVTVVLLRANPIVAVAAGLAVYGGAVLGFGLVTRSEVARVDGRKLPELFRAGCPRGGVLLNQYIENTRLWFARRKTEAVPTPAGAAHAHVTSPVSLRESS